MAFTLALLRQWHLHFVLVHRTLLLTSLQFVVWEEGAAYLYWNGLLSLQKDIFRKFVGKKSNIANVLPRLLYHQSNENKSNLASVWTKPPLLVHIPLYGRSRVLVAGKESVKKEQKVSQVASVCLLACYSRRDMRGTHMASLVNLAM